MRAVTILMLLAVVGLSACTTVPLGPGTAAFPGPGKPFDQFQAEDATCRQWARQQAGTTPEGAAAKSTATSATLGTLLGAGVGAAIGAVTGHPGTGAAVGAGGGLLAGSAVGVGAGQSASAQTQRRYDNAYTQCMYASGNQVPGVVPAPAPRGPAVAPPPPPPPPPAS